MDISNVDFLSLGVPCAVCEAVQYLPTRCRHCAALMCDADAAAHACAGQAHIDVRYV